MLEEDTEKVYTKLAECVICLGPMSKDIGVLPCGHIFHMECLGPVVDRMKQCPLDKRPVKRSDITKIHFNIENDQENVAFARNYKDGQLKLQHYQAEYQIMKESTAAQESKLKEAQKKVRMYEEKFQDAPKNISKVKEFPGIAQNIQQVLKKEGPTHQELVPYAPSDNLQNPEVGPFREDDNTIYLGQYKDKKRHGIGRIVHSNQNFYFGTFANHKYHGYGILVKPNKTYGKG